MDLVREYNSLGRGNLAVSAGWAGGRLGFMCCQLLCAVQVHSSGGHEQPACCRLLKTCTCGELCALLYLTWPLCSIHPSCTSLDQIMMDTKGPGAHRCASVVVCLQLLTLPPPLALLLRALHFGVWQSEAASSGPSIECADAPASPMA